MNRSTSLAIEPSATLTNHNSRAKPTRTIPITKIRVDGKPTLAQEEEDDNASADAVSVDEEPPSVVRQNLLGPLSFDDLYYT